MSKKVRGKTHRALRKPPASGRKPCCRKVTGRDIEAVADELVTYHRWFHAMFQRREQRQWSLFYLCGQLSNLKRKTIEPMILELHGAIPEAVRALARPAGVSQGKWEVHSLVVQLQALVAEWLGDPDGVVIADGSGFPTARPEGAHSAAVARQYCGQLGKIANCQEGVFLVYASRHGYTFLDERLYVPGEWFGDEYQDRWKACGLPGTLRFQTEPDLAPEMVQGLVHRDIVPFAWVTCDESFGTVGPAFLDEIAALNKWRLGVAEVPANMRVWLRTPPVEPPGRGPLGRPRPRVTRTAPRPQEMRELAARRRARVGLEPSNHQGRQQGTKWMVAEFAFVRVTAVRDRRLPGPRGWAVFRRSLGPGPEVKFYLTTVLMYFQE